MDNHIHVKLISLEDIYRTKCFDLKQIIQIIEDALLAYSNNEILLPVKYHRFLMKVFKLVSTACLPHC